MPYNPRRSPPSPHQNTNPPSYLYPDEDSPESTSRPGSSSEDNKLPPIRQALPEFDLLFPPESSSRRLLSTTSPGGHLTGIITPPEYGHSPKDRERQRFTPPRRRPSPQGEYTLYSANHKRRRTSLDDGRDIARAGQIPRIYPSPLQDIPQTLSPVGRSWSSLSGNCSNESRDGNGSIPSMCSPRSVGSLERRPTLPSLPRLEFDRCTGERHVARSQPVHASNGYATEAVRRPSLPNNSYRLDARSPTYTSPFSYSFHHPNRIQSLSVGSVLPFDRIPFSPEGYKHRYNDPFMRINEYGMGVSGDSKQRKRRGNLPKETTDKLRGWFVKHLHHPYPTEDEKQDLMRQTGLQMNQISNWFINARRRQLPVLMNNARAESGARNGRGVEGNVLSSPERTGHERDGTHLSDGEVESFNRPLACSPGTNGQRGSI
ncbi:hypothetical protein F5B20DRAFT_18201 [Whalleya microplaca]|nr:hypothetical protein F5B20DRAFT_18201 [Whalleya microplaca]